MRRVPEVPEFMGRQVRGATQRSTAITFGQAISAVHEDLATATSVVVADVANISGYPDDRSIKASSREEVGHIPTDALVVRPLRNELTEKRVIVVRGVWI